MTFNLGLLTNILTASESENNKHNPLFDAKLNLGNATIALITDGATVTSSVMQTGSGFVYNHLTN